MNGNKEEVIGFEALYKSMHKCKKTVLWKDSTANFYLNGIEQTLRLERELKSGTYKPRKPKKFEITHPKRRQAVSIAFRDRVYQRSLNDNVLYPTMTKSFIYTNMACQKGKGTDKARNVLDEMLKHHFRKYGLTGYVLQCDISGYYPNMDHRIVEEKFKEKLHPDIYQMAKRILKEQYEGNKGYNPGSQMVQIAGISVLDEMDHMIKEKLRVKAYERYMDDFILIGQTKKEMLLYKREIEKYLRKVGFELNKKKTKIFELREGIKFLGFTHRLTDTHTFLLIINPRNVQQERKKLRRMVGLVRKERMTKVKVNKCFESWKAHAEKGNSTKLITRMNRYNEGLWKENKNVDHKKAKNCKRTKTT